MTKFGEFPSQDDKPKSEAKMTDTPPPWERKVLTELAYAALKEQRSRRRWGFVFKGFIALYLVAILVLNYSAVEVSSPTSEHTALVEINGVIGSNEDANADTVVTGIRDAFDNDLAKALILRMNTPGGSPVQSGIINDEIRRLKQSRPDFPVYAVIQDVCASGGYYIAVAADEIYADKASIVGSIGVRMDSFGFTDVIKKVGVERRSITAGEHKAFLDPFLPMKQDDIQHAHEMLDTIHQQFIDVVKQGRGDKISNDSKLFSGLFWSGEQAVQLGLIDGLSNSSTLAREKIGAEDIIDYTIRPNYLDQFAGKLGTSIAQFFNTSLSSWRLQ